MFGIEKCVVFTDNRKLLVDKPYRAEYLNMNDVSEYDRLIQQFGKGKSELVILNLYGCDTSNGDVDEAETKTILAFSNQYKVLKSTVLLGVNISLLQPMHL